MSTGVETTRYTGRLSHAEWEERRAAGVKAREDRIRVRPRDLDRLKREGIISEGLKPLTELARQEQEEIVAQLGGPDEVTPARMRLIEDAMLLGVAFRAEFARFVKTGDPAALDRVSTLANTRRSNLLAVGLNAPPREAIDIQGYMARAEGNGDRATEANVGAEG